MNVALAFFTFSFQVHEKSILLVLMPMMLLHPKEAHFVRWFTVLANFSMYPLFKKEGLVVADLAVNLLWLWLTHDPNTQLHRIQKNFYRLTYVIMTIIFLLDWFVAPPAHLPDLFVMLNVLLSSFCVSLLMLLRTLTEIL